MVFVVLLGLALVASIINEIVSGPATARSSATGLVAGARVQLRVPTGTSAPRNEDSSWLRSCSACNSVWNAMTGGGSAGKNSDAPANPKAADHTPPPVTETDPGPLVGKTAPVEVDARSGWIDTGLEVPASVPFSIRQLSGQWSAAPATHSDVDADGHDYKESTSIEDWRRSKYLSSARTGALLASIGKKQPLAVGRDFKGMSDIAGRLYLRINEIDEGLADNHGLIGVEVQIEGR